MSKKRKRAPSPGGLPRPWGAKAPPGYLTLEQTGKRLLALNEAGVGRLHVLGHSVRGRPIWGVHMGPAVDEAPQIMIQAQIHAGERIGTALCLALLEHYQHAPHPQKTGLWVLPSTNPDGFARTLRRFQHGTMALGRKNANGVDLNRNWPVGFYGGGKGIMRGSTNPASLYYRGPHPISEPESKTLAALVTHQRIKASLSIHSIGEFLGHPPCRHAVPTPDQALFEQWAAAMTRAQRRPYRHGMEVDFYPAFGDFNDWLYEEKGVLAFLLEVGGMGLNPFDPQSWFQPLYWFNPMDVRPEIENNLPLVLQFIALAQDHHNLRVRGPGGPYAGKRWMEEGL